MPQEGQKTITMSGKRLERLEKEFQQNKSKQLGSSFSAFIADAALIELERRELINQAAYISLIAINDNVIILKDVEKRSFAEVYLRNRTLKCDTCNQDNCIHVGFALALPEIRKSLLTNG